MLQPKPLKHTITEYSEETGLGNCRVCGNVEVEASIDKRNGNLRKECKPHKREKNKLYMRKWARENPDIVRDRRYRVIFGISYADFLQMLEDQGGVCAICKTDYPGKKGWSLDHDGACCSRTSGSQKTCGKCIRAVLCNNCNTGLGLFKDNPETLQAAINYLAKHA